MTNDRLSANIKKFRLSLNMTQNDLALRLNVTTGAISAYELGNRAPSLNILIKMSALFKVSTDNLLGISNKYSLDVTELTPQQRNSIVEIINLYKIKNEYIKLLSNSNNILEEIKYVSKFDIEQHKK